MTEELILEKENLDFKEFKSEVLNDYKIARISREISYLIRKEVLTGKAKFGVSGDGKELPQIAMAKVFKNGDFRSGYYRDQTFLFAIGGVTYEQLFSQLYADTNIEREPHSGGRQMNAHFGTRLLDEKGEWKDLTHTKNTSSDISCTAGQMPRLFGLALASKLYNSDEYNKDTFKDYNKFTHNGNEVAFGTIGDASLTEGHFWETLNAAIAMQVPMILSIWDDGYGISVKSDKQRAKDDITDMLTGFQRKNNNSKGCEIIKVKGWDYPALIEAYNLANTLAREQSVPVVVHVEELTQPLGHSSSGSHERYKSKERLEWEKEHDGLVKFREWILDFNMGDKVKLADENELGNIEEEAKNIAKSALKSSWESYRQSIQKIKNQAIILIDNLIYMHPNKNFIQKEKDIFISIQNPYKKDIFHFIRKILRISRNENSQERQVLLDYYQKILKEQTENYSSHLYSESEKSAIKVNEIKPIFSDDSKLVDGRIVLRDNFEKLFEKYPELITFGEDTGDIGDVNQGMEGLQEKFGDIRISDTGIRELTIIGQGIGLAMRGFKPIAEIQYLDYILYGLQTISDDLATLHYRSKGGQKAPMIIRTRGHRLEGVWHAGSPMGGIINLVRGIYVLVPRDMTQAAGFYNTMLKSDSSAIIIESLNGYRLKEKMPQNIGEFTVPIGKIEITKRGSDITILTYGSTWKIVSMAAIELKSLDIDVEVIDIQSLIPFDINHDIFESVKKTNRILIVDEDVPGGASAYILNKVIEEQNCFKHLDSQPVTLTAKEHRTAYSTDGDYFSKPSIDDVVEAAYSIMNEANPQKFPKLF